MMCPITRLPPELWLQIIGLLRTWDVERLSLVCSSISKYTALRLFRCIRVYCLNNLDLMPLFIKRHGPIITKLRCEISLKYLEGDGEEDNEVCNLGMPPVLQRLLRGDGMPNLKYIDLGFSPCGNFNGFEFDDLWMMENADNGWEGFIYGDNYEDVHRESTEEVQLAELSCGWRADLWETFNAISRNTTLQHLEIRYLLPRECSVWWTKRWERLLGRLSSLSIRIWGAAGTISSNSNFRKCYLNFVKKLQPNFFKHLNKLKQLHLIANNPIGCEGKCHSSLPISAKDLPCIQNLVLEHFFIDPALQDFISARKDTLSRIKLTDCMAAPPGRSATNPISWATFFHFVQELQPANLTQFLVENEFFDIDSDDDIPEDILDQMYENKDKTVFFYACMDDLYNDEGYEEWGRKRWIWSHTVESYVNGQDRREYGALMKFVAKNAERAACSA